MKMIQITAGEAGTFGLDDDGCVWTLVRPMNYKYADGATHKQWVSVPWSECYWERVGMAEGPPSKDPPKEGTYR
jgi:hypothetical protein